MPALFVTGATGFVGRALIHRIAAASGLRTTALVRRGPDLHADSDIRYVRGDLLGADAWRSALEGADTVIHLAAATGKLPADAIRRANVDATERLLALAAHAGVRRFLYVSSIAAKFERAPHYHYASSKREAERQVLASELSTLIVRPTMVLGPGSPIGQRLRMLALAPVVPVFGNGRTRIQPIHVDDLAAMLLEMATADSFDGRVVEVGGPDAIGIEAFLGEVCRAVRGRAPRTIHVPVPPLREALALVERVSVGLVPFTAGQLASFTNDGTVDPEAAWTGAVQPEHDIRSLIACTAISDA